MRRLPTFSLALLFVTACSSYAPSEGPTADGGQALQASRPRRPAAPADYRGFLEIPNLTAITPKIIATRLSAAEPFLIQVHAAATKVTFSDGGAAFAAMVGRPVDPYSDLEFSWDFGDPRGTEEIAHPVTGETLDANTDQTGGHAAYVYRTPGKYTITLTVRAWTGSVYVTASTTKLYTEASQQLSIRNAPTGGTYTVRFGGQTTAPVPYNARCDEFKDALELLSNIGKGNVEVYNGPQPTHSKPFQIYFTGNLAGRDQPPLTSDISGLTGGKGARAMIRRESAGATAAVATCTPFAGKDRYFDSNYVDNPADGVRGTITRPFTTYAQVQSWVMGGNHTAVAPKRRTLLKRGSSWAVSSAMSFEGGKDGARIVAYGTGPRPKFTKASGHILHWSTFYERDNLRANKDFVIDGIEVESDSDDTIKGVYSTNGPNTNIFSLPRHLHFLDCKIVGGLNVGMSLTDVAYWRCTWDVNGTYIPSQPCLVSATRWQSFVGCSFTGGGNDVKASGVMTLHHHIYSSATSLALYRWIKFNRSHAHNYSINGNLPGLKGGSPKRAPYHLVDGCDITGTQNGLDFSSTNNNPNNAYIDRIVIQDCDFHVGQVGAQGYGILANNPALITIRDNRWYTNRQHDIFLAGTLRQPSLYRNKSWRTGGVFFRVGGAETTTGFVSQNQLVNTLGAGKGPKGLMSVYPALKTHWYVGRNQLYTPQDAASPPFHDATGNRGLSLAEWQALGLDRDSEIRAKDFGWKDPARGDFSVDSPEGSPAGAPAR